MQLDMMLLANYAEAPTGLLYIIGGGIDTVTVNAPLEGPNVPSDAFTVMNAYLVVRLAFHSTETGREHAFEIGVVDEDGNELPGKAGGSVRVERQPGLPPNWAQKVNIVMPLLGLPIPKPGQYVVNLTVNGQFVGDTAFRVLKGF